MYNAVKTRVFRYRPKKETCGSSGFSTILRPKLKKHLAWDPSQTPRHAAPAPSALGAAALGAARPPDGASAKVLLRLGFSLNAPPSHLLTWKCTDLCRKTTFLLERAFLHFHVSWWEGSPWNAKRQPASWGLGQLETPTC